MAAHAPPHQETAAGRRAGDLWQTGGSRRALWLTCGRVDVLRALNRIRRWQTQRRLRHGRIPLRLWQAAVGDLLDFYRLDHRERRELRELASLFLQEKTISGAGGLAIDASMRTYITAQACLLILYLGLDYYEGWREVIVYPDSFVVSREERDTAGVVHSSRRTLGGEAWLRGPVVLSWEAAKTGSDLDRRGSSVILHEFAHKLDMLTGSANGMPPLHPNMLRADWTAALSRAYRDFGHRVEHHHGPMDPYGAESPAEFFAVVTGVFFEHPASLRHAYPEVYRQLRLFYRQDPAARMSGHR